MVNAKAANLGQPAFKERHLPVLQVALHSCTWQRDSSHRVPLSSGQAMVRFSLLIGALVQCALCFVFLYCLCRPIFFVQLISLPEHPRQSSGQTEVLLLVIAALIAWRQPVVSDDPLLKFTGHDPSNISWNWEQLVTARTLFTSSSFCM